MDEPVQTNRTAGGRSWGGGAGWECTVSFVQVVFVVVVIIQKSHSRNVWVRGLITHEGHLRGEREVTT